MPNLVKIRIKGLAGRTSSLSLLLVLPFVFCLFVIIIIIITFFITIVDKPLESMHTAAHKEPAPACRPLHSET